ncbi:MAG: hypothetical protein ABFS38_03215 [Bacteroidota bacterium]
MYKFKSLLFPLIMGFVWLLNGCSTEPAVSYQVLHIEGVTWACNISTSYAAFGSTIESGKSEKVTLPVSDGDLLYAFNEDDHELYYRYRVEEGNRLVVTFDTVNTNSAHVNGSLASLQLSQEPASWEKFKGLSPTEVSQLSSLYIQDNLTKEILNVLKVHELSLQGTGVVLENSTGSGALKSLLSICRPEWLGLEGGVDLSGASHEKFLSDLELLWISEDIQAVSNIINCCTNLEALIITEWEPSRGELITLDGLKNLHSLTLAACSITDLSNLELPASLTRLHLIGCDTLTNIDGLDQISNLASLSLSGSDQVEPLEVINNLESLKWISFPGNTTQEAFLSILNSQEMLEVVEINQCSLISNLSLLEDQVNLKALIFNAEKYDMEQLVALDQVELIILNSTFFDDSPEMISQLRTQLPNTEIVPGSGLCLGSGWLMLLLPLILLARFMVRNRSQS